MKKALRIGIVGGTGPATTCRYYQDFIAEAKRDLPAGHIPEISIESIDCGAVFEALADADMGRLAEIVTGAVRRLEAAGVQTAAFAGFSAHLVLDAVRRAVPAVEILSIVEPAAALAKDRGWKRLGVLANARVAADEALFAPFARLGCTLVRPLAAEQARMNAICEQEVEFGIRRPESLAFYQGVIARMHREEGIEALLLANTDFPAYLAGLALPVPAADCTAQHIEALIGRYRESCF